MSFSHLIVLVPCMMCSFLNEKSTSGAPAVEIQQYERKGGFSDQTIEIYSLRLCFALTGIITVQAGPDDPYYISNIKVPMFQQWGSMDVYRNSHGSYIGMHLDMTGKVADTIEFVAKDPNGNPISEIGQCTEGVSGYKYVKYSDGQNYRWLTRVDVRSYRFNSGAYYIYGQLNY